VAEILAHQSEPPIGGWRRARCEPLDAMQPTPTISVRGTPTAPDDDLTPIATARKVWDDEITPIGETGSPANLPARRRWERSRACRHAARSPATPRADRYAEAGRDAAEPACEQQPQSE